jgi:dTDP-4-dehydrorhamnose reductase
MRVLITGAKGMLGRDLVDIMSDRFEVEAIDIEDSDITRFGEIRQTIRDKRPEFVIHCAAYTDVDGCEVETGLSYRINGLGTRNVVACSAELDVPVLYISTDFVFDGRKPSPYREYDNPDPISEYGYGKVAGEFFVRHLHNRFYIVRTSWLYGSHGKNFVDTILKIADQKGELKVVNDQFGSPTYTRDLAGKLVDLIEVKAGYGIYHITNSGACSWCDFAGKILATAGLIDVKLEPITSEELGRAARRPSNSVLENRAIGQEGLEPLRSWEEALSEYLHSSRIKIRQGER